MQFDIKYEVFFSKIVLMGFIKLPDLLSGVPKNVPLSQNVFLWDTGQFMIQI